MAGRRGILSHSFGGAALELLLAPFPPSPSPETDTANQSTVSKGKPRRIDPFHGTVGGHDEVELMTSTIFTPINRQAAPGWYQPW